MARTRIDRRARNRRAKVGVPALHITGAEPTVEPAGVTAVDGVEMEALSVTHWLTPEPHGAPYAATVRFSGRRVGISGKPGRRDTFVKEETFEGIVPGSDPVSITTWVGGLQPGKWTVSADLVRRSRGAGAGGPARGGRASGGHTLPRAAWSWWRWSLKEGGFAAVRTRWGPLVRLTPVPAVIPGSWSVLVASGVVVGALVHALLLDRLGMPVGPGLLVDLVAVLAGLLGAKLWYLALRPRGSPRQSIGEGWTVDGFLFAVPVVVLALMVVLDLPVGPFFDAGTPGLFFGVAIGRLGCFFTGCCAGRCTRSRWGIWSSDRRLGARRIPTQLLESGAGLLIALATLLLVLGGGLVVGGATFVGGLAAYVLIRQALLRLRAEPHHPVRTRVTAAVAGVVLLAVVVVSVVAPG